MPEAPIGLRAGTATGPAYVAMALTSCSWKGPYERVQPPPGIGAEKDRRADTPDAEGASQRSRHHPVRANAGGRLIRGGRARSGLYELPPALARPEPHLWSVLRAGRGLSAPAAVARASPCPAPCRQRPRGARQADRS